MYLVCVMKFILCHTPDENNTPYFRINSKKNTYSDVDLSDKNNKKSARSIEQPMVRYCESTARKTVIMQNNPKSNFILLFVFVRLYIYVRIYECVKFQV